MNQGDSKELRAEGLTKYFSKRAVVEDLSLFVKQGEVVGLLGPNGAGKTTTFYMLVGLLRPDRGKVFLKEEEITDL
ncbi:MAG: ATP-binding cassette domain-containing protein, partial [Desulfatiglandales bacterium]